jgi:hypothetical protein
MIDDWKGFGRKRFCPTRGAIAAFTYRIKAKSNTIPVTGCEGP